MSETSRSEGSERRAELHLSEGFYRALFETTPDGITLIDDAGYFLAVNPTMCRLLHGSESQIVGRHFSEFIVPERRDEAVRDYVEHGSQPSDFIDMQHMALDGAVVVLEWRVRRNVQPGVHLGVARELGDLRRTQRALEDRIAELDVLLDVIPVGVGIARDRECRRIDVNARLAELLGIPRTHNASLSAPDTERPRSFVCRIDGRVLEPDELPMQTAAREGTTISDLEVEIVRDDGVTMRLLEFAAPLFDESGGTRGSVGAFVDITERRQHEIERAELLEREMQARQRAESAERRATVLSEVSAMLATTLEHDEAVNRVGGVLVPRIADWCTVELVDESGELQLVAVTHVDPSKEQWGFEVRRRFPLDMDAPHGSPNVLRTGEPEFYPLVTPEMIAAASDDPEVLEVVRQVGYTSVIIVPMIARGRTLGTLQLVTAESGRRFTQEDVVFSQSIATRVAFAIDNIRLREQAELARAEAESANRAKDKFLAVLSHELRTPLTPVLTALHLLRDDLGERPETAKLLGMMQRNIELEARLIDDLLDVTRITRGAMTIHPEVIDLHDVLRSVEEIWRHEAAARGITLELELGATRTTLHADGSRLQQVFWNLVGNAIKFTPPDGRVRIVSRNEGADAVVEVVDTGAGIDQEHLASIFDPFFQSTHPGRGARRDGGGLGLGLAIARAIVDRHGGEISAASGGEGRGAVFTVRLPGAGG